MRETVASASAHNTPTNNPKPQAGWGAGSYQAPCHRPNNHPPLCSLPAASSLPSETRQSATNPLRPSTKLRRVEVL